MIDSACVVRCRLVLLVAVEAAKGAQSAWGPYLAALPKSYTDPLWWDDELLQVRSPSSRQPRTALLGW